MAVITYEEATDIIIENIKAERKYADGVQTAYRITPHEDYVLHSPSLDAEIYDPETGLTHTEQYYYRIRVLSVVRPVSTWDWEAALESSVPADMIFGSGDNNHEVM